MLKIFTALFGGAWGYVIVGMVLAIFGIAGMGYFDGIKYGKQIDELKLSYANERAASISASLTTLQNYIARMDKAGSEYQFNISSIEAQFAKLEQEFKNEKIIPLPSDCKPDNVRMRQFDAAVAAANSKNTSH